MLKKFFIISLLSLVFLYAKIYSAKEAISHIGEKATVCGYVASTHYAFNSRGQPTFLNIDEAYPNQIFTIIIWGDDRDVFNEPEKYYANKNICITGKLKNYNGNAEIIAYSPKQIKIKR